MSLKILNDNTPHLNHIFLDMPFYRELFVDHKTSQRADTYHTRKNTWRTNQLLSELLSQWKNMNDPRVKEDYSKLLSDFLISSQKWNDAISGWLNNLSHNMQWLWSWIENISSNMENFAYQMSDSLESIYGSNLPENISLVDIGRKLSYYGKRTIVSLYIHWWIYDWRMKELFSPVFIEYLNKWMSSSSAKEHQMMMIEKLNELKELKARIKSNIAKNNQMVQNNPTWNKHEVATNNLSELSQKLSLVESNIQNIGKYVVPKWEIDLLDVWLVARQNNINYLLRKKMIHPEVLEVLVRNKQVRGNLSTELSRIIQVNENWIVKPLIELDWITWIFQQEKAQTMLQNIIVKQNNLTNSHLFDINQWIREWFDWTIDAIDENTWEIIKWFGWTIDAIDWNTWEVRNVNNTLKKWFIMTNYNLDRVSGFIQETNKELWFVNVNLNKVNFNLEDISDRVAETNIYLYDILSSSHKWNELLAQNNELQQFTNEYLDAINMNILQTWEWLANILQWIWEVIWEWFEQTIQWLNNIANLQYEQLRLSEYVLQEMSKQTEILQNIDNALKNVNRSLKTPYSIRADEAFSQWLSCVKVSNIDFAIKSFEKWIEQDPTHLWNIFWAGTLYNALWKTKKAREYLNAALKISLSTNNPIIKNIYYELAKLETKQLNLRAWKSLLQESMSTRESNLEIYLMQIDILLKLWENLEAEVLTNKLFNQIITGDYNTKWVKNRKGVAKFLKWKTESFVNFLIKNWKTNELIKIIKFLEIMWYNNIVQDVFLYLFEHYREWFYENKIQLKNYIKWNDKIINAIKNFANKNYIGWNSETHFYIAYQCYRILEPNIVNKIISNWLNFDIDYVYMNESKDTNTKMNYRTRLAEKIYSFWDNAKYMRRDYLNQNNIFNF